MSAPLFSWKEREAALQSLEARPAELLVIGGGVVGCSVAAHAAALGLDCVLVEREDFASGASGNSTGLAHAGLRYLAKGRIGYVFREARERQFFQQIAPHWVRPFSFLFPVYHGDPFGLRAVRLGTAIYDWLYRLASLGIDESIVRRYRVVSPREMLERVPGLSAEGLEGGAEYFVDGRLIDSRFTLGFAQKAAQQGARVINHAIVQSVALKDGQLTGAVIQDALTGRAYKIGARLAVNASGPWIDAVRQLAGLTRPLVQNSKGIHLIVDCIAENALILSTRVRGQVFFVIPMGKHLSLVGTTDTPHPGSPDNVRPDASDVSELVTHLFRFFPKLKPLGSTENKAVQRYRDDHAHRAYWGLRPLLLQRGGTVDASREHRLIKERGGLWSVPGVKLTAGRRVGEQASREAWKCLRGCAPPDKAIEILPGGEFKDFDAYVRDAESRPGSLPLDALKYLIGRYGTLYTEVLRWADQEPELSERVLPEEPWIYAEAAYAVHHEMTLTLSDFLWRRARWARLRDLPDACLQRIAGIMARFLEWTDTGIRSQIDAFKKELAAHQLK